MSMRRAETRREGATEGRIPRIRPCLPDAVTACRPGIPVMAEAVTVDQVGPGETFHLTSWSGPRSVRYTVATANCRISSTHAGGGCYPPIAENLAADSIAGGR